jgi:hypothetical protein
MKEEMLVILVLQGSEDNGTRVIRKDGKRGGECATLGEWHVIIKE